MGRRSAAGERVHGLIPKNREESGVTGQGLQGGGGGGVGDK